MPQDDKQQPDPQETNPAQDGAGSGDATTPTPKSPKVYTADEVNAMVARRLAKLRDSIRREVEQEIASEAEKAKLDAAERAKREAEEWRAKAEAAEKARALAERKAAIAGRVSDPDYALYKIEQNPEKYLGEDGTVDVDALIADHPILATEQQKPQTGTPPASGAAGSLTSKATALADLERQLASARTRAERVHIQSRINELRKKG